MSEGDHNNTDSAAMVIAASASVSGVASAPRQREAGESSVAAIDLALGLLMVSDRKAVGVDREKSDFSVATDRSSVGNSEMIVVSDDTLLTAWDSADLPLLALRASNRAAQS